MLLIGRRCVSKKVNGRKVPAGYNRHHRKPRRFGGDNNGGNISVVPKVEHRAWNILFDNEPAPEVVRRFVGYWEAFGNDPQLVREIRQIGLSVLREIEEFNKFRDILDELELRKIKKILATQRVRAQKECAWGILFGGRSLEEIVKVINEVWLDPDYKIRVEDIQTQRIILVST